MSATSPRLHFPAGWRLAFAEAPTGRTWIVSAFVTVGDLPWPIRTGDRVLVRGQVRDVVHGATDTAALRSLRDAGAEIRALSTLHAKLYVREDGDTQIAWAGSANLTAAGRGDSNSGESGRNVEAMAGPFVVRDLSESLDRLWRRAEPLDIDALEEAANRVRDDEARRVALTWTGGFFIARLHRRNPSASIVMERKWFLEDPEHAPPTGHTTVRLIRSQEPFWKGSRDLAREVIGALRRYGVVQDPPIGHGRFLVAVEDADYLVASLDEANRRLAASPDEPTRTALAESLERRVEDTLRRLLTAPDGLPTPPRSVQDRKIEEAQAAARRKLARYLEAGAAGIYYELSIPVGTNDPEIGELIQHWRERGATVRPRLFAERPEDPAVLLSEAEARVAE